ncbi:NAD(P)H-binding protein [Actinomadura kijaniata]|uniref:NAD(P)H-binding protein n=1 Tax=Actinomadura kijaniata TaxID=46161 RepID=UPI00083038AB|nr:NAD(P)H-binding protein [Actinomadura kijaniata]
MFVITGATGNVGRHVVAELLDAGHKVRALSRDPATAALPDGTEVARTADLPLEGATGVLLNPAAFWNGVDELLDRARQAGVRRIVVLSSSAVLAGEGNPIGDHHLAVERQVEATGLEWTHLRPGAFAANALGWADQIRGNGVVRGPHARAHTVPIDERDIAAVAARALTGDDLVGTRPELSGPESLTFADQARIIGEAIGRPVTYEELSPEAARAAMTYAPEPVVDALLTFWAEAVDRPQPVSSEVERITGRPARTFAEWAADHVRDFA